MAFTCDSCRRRRRGRPQRSVTGRYLCPRCHGNLQARSAARMMGTGRAVTRSTVGWLDRVRRQLGRND